MTIHNIAFQGRFFPRPMSDYGLPESAADDFFFEDGYNKVYDETNLAKEDGKEEFDGKIYRKSNWLKAGFANSDRNLTVSENYAKEISSSKSKGVELDDVIRKYCMEGIVNGMDPPNGTRPPTSSSTFRTTRTPLSKVRLRPTSAPSRSRLAARRRSADLRLHRPSQEQKGVDIFMKAVQALKACSERASRHLGHR